MEVNREFDLTTIYDLCDDPHLWTPQRDYDWQTYEARVGDFTVGIWKRNNTTRVPIIGTLIDHPTYHMEIYRDTGRHLERHMIYRMYADEVKPMYDAITAGKLQVREESLRRYQNKEPDFLSELEGILGKREHAA